MNIIAQLARTERRDLFEAVALRTKLTPLIIEKDFWVCWTLQRLFEADSMPRLLFKGGTSLSKCYGLIDRFSEDIDLGVHRASFGFDNERDPAARTSRKGFQKALAVMLSEFSLFTKGTLLPSIRNVFDSNLKRPSRLSLDTSAPEKVITFKYEQALEPNAYGQGNYIAAAVRIELGARADHFPVERKALQALAAEGLPEGPPPLAWVTAQVPERTLLEKALILHSDLTQGQVRPQTSRHAYDLHQMLEAGVMSSVTRDLFEEVARHKLVFSNDKRASLAPTSGIQLALTPPAQAALASDYKRMRPMFFGQPPSFDAIVASLSILEARINSLKSSEKP